MCIRDRLSAVVSVLLFVVSDVRLSKSRLFEIVATHGGSAVRLSAHLSPHSTTPTWTSSRGSSRGMSACRSACHKNNFRKSRVSESDVSARILASMSVSVPAGVVECGLYTTQIDTSRSVQFTHCRSTLSTLLSRTRTPLLLTYASNQPEMDGQWTPSPPQIAVGIGLR